MSENKFYAGDGVLTRRINLVKKIKYLILVIIVLPILHFTFLVSDYHSLVNQKQPIFSYEKEYYPFDNMNPAISYAPEYYYIGLGYELFPKKIKPIEIKGISIIKSVDKYVIRKLFEVK